MAHSEIPFRTFTDAIAAGQELAASVADGSFKTDIQCSAHRLLTLADYASTFLPNGHSADPTECPTLTDDEFFAKVGALGVQHGTADALDWKSILIKAIQLIQILLPLVIS